MSGLAALLMVFCLVVMNSVTAAGLASTSADYARFLQCLLNGGALDGQRMEVRADVGVGVVHLSRDHADVEDILHDAQRMAEAARGMRSRAAMLDPQTGELVPVEMANLGPRRHGRPGRVPHATPVKAQAHAAQRA